MHDVDRVAFWQDIYDAGDTRWDLGGPTPVFVQLQTSKQFPPGRMLVPGAGRGYDAIWFAQQGFDVTAVDFAESAVHDARANGEKAGVAVDVVQNDIFDVGAIYPHTFDYVLEYTCFCAIDPNRRAEYMEVIRSVLKPNGLLIAIFFPMDARDGGPPFQVREEEIDRLFSPHFERVLTETPENSVAPRAGKERLMIFRKVNE